MTRKHTRRRVIVPLPPRGLRPRLAPDQLRDLGLAHVANLDAVASGQADEATLWQIVGGCLTWSRAAELIGAGVDEMREQLDLATRLVERYGRSGRVLFTGTEYQLAKRGVLVMDLLAEQVDRPTAIAAAEWSEQRVGAMEAACSSRSVSSPIQQARP
jgi:hypothetical protein